MNYRDDKNVFYGMANGPKDVTSVWKIFMIETSGHFDMKNS